MSVLRISTVCLLGLISTPLMAADATEFESFDRTFVSSIRPLMVRDCQKCHSEKVMEAEIDLSQFRSLADVRRHPDVWQKVSEMLDSGQMPPKDEPQPTDAERTAFKQWVTTYLKAEARASAGDPGRVVLRRLNNVEYTNTIRDLTGVRTLQPAREFPVDSAAGEGFTNLGNALVMSPALVTKYLDAAKEIASHAVLVPDGFRFSPAVTAQDWTDDLLVQIRKLYAGFTDSTGSAQISLQGVLLDTNGGGRLPLERYLEATLLERDALLAGKKTFAQISRERDLSPKYLGLLWDSLNGTNPSFLLDGLRTQWRQAKPGDGAAIAAEITRWQQSLWRFTTVGHIGKLNGPKAWMEPIDPVTTRTEVRKKLPEMSDGQEMKVYLTATDVGDGNENDYVIWERPRLVAPGRIDLPLRDVKAYVASLLDRRDRMLATIVSCLNAVASALAKDGKVDPKELAQQHQVDAEIVTAWMDYLGVDTGQAAAIDHLFTAKLNNVGGYDFVSGWGSHDTPLLLANSSDQHVRVPGNMKPHGVAVHPSPTLSAAVGWKSPIAATLRVEARIQHAHPECGNGVTWSLELRRGVTRKRLANGVAAGAKQVVVDPIENLKVHPDDLISLLIGPRDANHSCDLTAIDLVLKSTDKPDQVWDLAADISPDVQAGNPHADRLGHSGVWHFYTEPTAGIETGVVIPAESLMAKWQAASGGERTTLAASISSMLNAPPPPANTPDAQLYWQLRSLSGPLLRSVRLPDSANAAKSTAAAGSSVWGVDAGLFGKHPNGQPVAPDSLCVKAPSFTEVTLPSDLVNGWELVASGTLHGDTGKEGTAQLQVLTTKPEAGSQLVAGSVKEVNKNSRWTDNNKQITYSTPILVSEGSAAHRRVAAALEEYRNLFPIALCYSRIVPVDEVVTLTIFYREDHHLKRLMLDEAQSAQLDRLWSELHFVSQDALKLVDGFTQLMEFATQDADPKVFEPLRQPVHDRAKAFRQELIDAEPRQLDRLIEFANLAYRRPLERTESQGLRDLYRKLREQGLPHDEAIRFTLARILVAPAFLYRVEPISESPAGATTQSAGTIPVKPVSDWALASRLSYFLWSTMPDDELRACAASNRLHEPDVLIEQTRRMLKDNRARALASEFACQWLGVRDFDTHSEKSEQVFPTFNDLRDEMYEESMLFFQDLFQRNGSVLDILDADYTYLNESLAKHYGIPDIEGPQWRRVSSVKRFGRGGILTQATTLAKQSGASRTSPILRGNWVLETLLGERLQRPPKNVPPLPEAETDTQLTVRQLVEAHRSIESCAHCHERIDAFGFSLESYDAIGRRRDKDLGGRDIDVNVVLKDGTRFNGETGLKDYLLRDRQSSFVRHFCRKLLGYAVARGVQLSDEVILDQMMSELKRDDFRVSAAIETIVRSPQFRFQRVSSQ